MLQKYLDHFSRACACAHVLCNLCPISLDWIGCFFGRHQCRHATTDADGTAAPPHGIGVAVAWITHEVKVSPSPH